MCRSLMLTLAALSVALPAAAEPLYKADIGQGIDLSGTNPEAVDVCVDDPDTFTDVSWAGDVQLDFFEVRSSHELFVQLSSHGEVEALKVFKANAKMNAMLDADKSSIKTAFVVSVRTARLDYDGPSPGEDDYAPYGACTEDWLDEDSSTDPYQQFIDRCGTRWVTGETRGGTVIGVIDTDRLSEKIEAGGELGYEGTIKEVTGKGGIMGKLETYLAASKTDVRVVVHGLPVIKGTGSYFTTDKDGHLTVSFPDLLSYIDAIAKAAFDDVDDGKLTSTNYGQVVNQDTATTRSLMKRCGIKLPSDVRSELVCYDDATHLSAWTSRLLDGKTVPGFSLPLHWVPGALASSDDFAWGQAPKATKKAYKDAWEHVQVCLSDVLPEVDASCRKAGDKDWTAGLCEASDPDDWGACELPGAGEVSGWLSDHGVSASYGVLSGYGCTEADLQNLRRAFPEVPAVLPDGPSVTERVHVQDSGDAKLGDVETSMCVLSGLSGRFAGTGEAVHVQSDTGTFYLSIDSGRTKSNELIHAEALCVDIDAFSTTDDSFSWLEATEDSARSGGGSDLEDRSYGLALQGVKGAMNAGSDQASVKPGASSSTVDVSGVLWEAWATSFGVEHSDDDYVGKVKDFSVSTVGTANAKADVRKTTMIRRDEGFCHLRAVGGEFDGHAERVRIIREGGHYKLTAQAACTDRSGFFGGGDCLERKPVSAHATCYLYEQ